MSQTEEQVTPVTVDEDEIQEYVCAVCYFDPETHAMRTDVDHILTLCGKVDDPDMAKGLLDPDKMCRECERAVLGSMIGIPFSCGHTMTDIMVFQRDLGLERLNGIGDGYDPRTGTTA